MRNLMCREYYWDSFPLLNDLWLSKYDNVQSILENWEDILPVETQIECILYPTYKKDVVRNSCLLLAN